MRLLLPAARPVDAAVVRGRGRLRVVMVCFGVAFFSIGARLVDTVLARDDGIQTALAGAVGPDPRRADIVDRNGLLLATNLRVPSVFADPALIPDLDHAAERLAAVLDDLDAGRLKRRLRASKRFAWVKHDVTPAEQKAVLGLGIPGVGFRDSERRVYPRESLTSHLVGFVDVDNQGIAGIEHSMQERLVGGKTAGKVQVELSLDLRIQQIVHDELVDAYRRFRAKGAAGIVLDRITGEILAMVSLPDFDPNRVDRATVEGRKNRISGNTYELGSLFKVVTAAMALDSGRVGLGDRFDATQPLRIGRNTIRDDHAKNRWLGVPEVFMYSSNIGTARMAFQAGGAETQREFLGRLGLLARPSLEIPEVARPQLPPKWSEIASATISFGHGLAISPLQFVDAVAGMVGDGTHVPPTVLKRDPADLPPRQRLVGAKTAESLDFLMWLTIESGTGTRAKVPGYLVGGKTGTADKVNPNGRGYLHGSVIASFVGVFPLERPRYVVLVMLDDPRGDETSFGLRYAGYTAAPVVREIIARSGPVLGVPPSDPAIAARLQERWLAVKSRDQKRVASKEQRVAAVGADR
jgi:cell division protein FtsI (penicillin-binding protein 3)